MLIWNKPELALLGPAQIRSPVNVFVAPVPGVPSDNNALTAPTPFPAVTVILVPLMADEMICADDSRPWYSYSSRSRCLDP